MAVLNQANVRKVRTHLATMAGVLKSVASGDSEGALQTLESIVGGDDNEQFEDLLDSQETLAHLVTLAESSLDEDEEEDEESDDSDEEDEDEESEDEDDVATASVKTGSPKHKRIMKERAAFLGIAQAGFDEDEEDEDDEEDDSEDDEDFEDDEADSETDDDSEDDSEESEEDEESEDDEEDDEEEEDEATAKVTARFKKNLTGRKKAQASVSKPKVAQKASKANANSDGRL